MTSLFENATEGIILTDGGGRIVLVNPKAQKMFGYEAAELQGKPVEVLIPFKYRDHHVKLREGFHKDPKDRVMGHGRDLFGTTKNGGNFPVEVSLSSYRSNGESFVIAFIIDITLRKEAEMNMLKQQRELESLTAEMRKLNSQLEAKVEERTAILKEALTRLETSQRELSEALDKERELNEIKGRFVSMASHEFRTPLSTILSSASLAGKYSEIGDTEKAGKHLGKIRDSVKHLNNILEDFLNLGKLDEAKVATGTALMDWNSVLQETIEEMRAHLKDGQTISFTHEGRSVIESDPKLLKNIMMNLLGNAIKFSPENTVVSVISVATATELRVTVSDRGIGIMKEDQDHLFSSFFRGKNAVHVPGTGLGLHIVKRYIELLNGTINVASELNKGTSISFTIPATS
jgi:PAS domain S-box-containing protein